MLPPVSALCVFGVQLLLSLASAATNALSCCRTVSRSHLAPALAVVLVHVAVAAPRVLEPLVAVEGVHGGPLAVTPPVSSAGNSAYAATCTPPGSSPGTSWTGFSTPPGAPPASLTQTPKALKPKAKPPHALERLQAPPARVAAHARHEGPRLDGARAPAAPRRPLVALKTRADGVVDRVGGALLTAARRRGHAAARSHHGPYLEWTSKLPWALAIKLGASALRDRATAPAERQERGAVALGALAPEVAYRARPLEPTHTPPPLHPINPTEPSIPIGQTIENSYR